MSQGVSSGGEVNWFNQEAEAKATCPQPRKRRGARCARLESPEEDPKPVDLFLGRLKPYESGVEDRTVSDVQIDPLT